MEIRIQHSNIDWIIVIDDYDYSPEEAETGPSYSCGGDPGWPETLDINAYHLEIDFGTVCKELTELINDQLWESNKLCDHIMNLHDELINDLAIEMHHAEFN